METKKTLKDRLFQLAGNGQPIITGSVAPQDSSFFLRLFDPNTVSLAQFFNTLFKTAIVVGAMLAVLRLGYAGFVYMTTDVMHQKQSAKSIISNAVLGLLLLLAVWLILNQINPQILDLNILQNVQAVPNTGSPAAPIAPGGAPVPSPFEPAPTSP